MAEEKRLIDANALMDAFRSYMVERYDKEKCVSEENCKICEKSCLWRKIVSVAPTVDAVEVVHGRWVKHKPKPEAMRAWHRQGIGKAMSENSIFWTCSCCEEWGTPRYNYCPNCGAKMDGGNEEC